VSSPVGAAGWFDGFANSYTGEAISENDWEVAAKELSCEVAAIKAVAQVESGPLGAYWKPGWPTILFERHLFSKHSGRRFDKSNPDISSSTLYRFAKPAEKKGGLKDDMYAWTPVDNYARLERAYALDATAALKSPSWGRFQVLGQNHKDAGYPASVQDYVKAMCTSEKEQLVAFVRFLKADARLLDGIRKRDWKGFAAAYNGVNYAMFNYDARLSNAYDSQTPKGS